MLLTANEPPPAGGAALDQVIGLTAGAAIVTAGLLWIAWAHRTHRIEWFQNAGERLRERTGEPGWSSIPTLFVASSLIVALLGFLWDVSLHAGRGRDAGPLANPAHYLILYGLFALFVAGMSAVVYPRDGEKPGIASVRITRTVVRAGQRHLHRRLRHATRSSASRSTTSGTGSSARTSPCGAPPT